MSKAQDIFGYQSLSQEKPHKKELSRVDRFASIEIRQERGDIPTPVWETLLKSSYKQHWKDLHIQKSAMEMVIYPMLMYELRPKTIIEIGAFNGGSAVWLADNLQLFGIEGQIYSVDINLSFLDEKAKKDERIHFLEGDSYKIDEVFPAEMLSGLPHPWLVIEDAHFNIVGILEYFHQKGLQTGDYLIVEDTNLYGWEYWNESFNDEDNGEAKQEKNNCVKDFLLKYTNDYRIDTYYQDLFGYNGSKCWNSIMKRV
ncbi:MULTISPECIES: CmcI family methyltransferase [Moorena]|uniref:Cephalosporin hydroxylase n=1 Tax=Moorena producens 3L TaxID=489825 RepID=F4XMB9_9CYAN|nr:MULTISPECIES: CmcI family methyltransferase [Moorena]EGJ33828.1 cephalosporin hydroxylase [Moorena producens 3L]NEP35399.1 cephalosporin hydroxylase [Moorena sp. SIO3B2]NEP67879.1 cephalosporin hydroxylase [Moorena sp. SIO3A5]OLT68993.1 cephalosporin hydroxylase [Moorena producens 3L]